MRCVLLRVNVGKEQPEPFVLPRLVTWSRMSHQVLIYVCQSAFVSTFQDMDNVGKLIFVPAIQGREAELFEN